MDRVTQPRNYQTAAVDAFIAHYYTNGNSKGILHMASGTGKTFTLWHTILRAREDYGIKVVVYATCSLTDVLTQTADFLVNYSNEQANIKIKYCSSQALTTGAEEYTAKNNDVTDKDLLVLVMTHKYLSRCISDVGAFFLDSVALVVVDDYHRITGRNYDKDHTPLADKVIIGSFSKAKVIFASATSVGDDADGPYGSTYYAYLQPDALAAGVISQVQYQQMDKTDAYGTSLYQNSVVLLWFLRQMVNLGRHRAIIYADKNIHASRCISIFNRVRDLPCDDEEVINTVCVDTALQVDHATTQMYAYNHESPDRAKLLRKFRDPTPNMIILVCSQSLTGGMDIPECDSVLFYDHMRSQISAAHIIGVVSRPQCLPDFPKVKMVFIPCPEKDRANFKDVFAACDSLYHCRYDADEPNRPRNDRPKYMGVRKHVNPDAPMVEKYTDYVIGVTEYIPRKDNIPGVKNRSAPSGKYERRQPHIDDTTRIGQHGGMNMSRSLFSPAPVNRTSPPRSQHRIIPIQSDMFLSADYGTMRRAILQQRVYETRQRALETAYKLQYELIDQPNTTVLSSGYTPTHAPRSNKLYVETYIPRT